MLEEPFVDAFRVEDVMAFQTSDHTAGLKDFEADDAEIV